MCIVCACVKLCTYAHIKLHHILFTLFYLLPVDWDILEEEEERLYQNGQTTSLTINIIKMSRIAKNIN